MRVWIKAPTRMFCGGRCAGIIDVGEPMLVIVLPDVQRQRQRCARCAGEPVDYEALLKAEHAQVGTAAPGSPQGFARLGDVAKHIPL